MALQADKHGFLVGDPIDIGRAIQQLRDIKNDVAAIRRAVATPNASKRRESGSGSAVKASNVAVPTGGLTQASQPSRALSAVAVPIGRDASGKFIPSGNHEKAVKSQSGKNVAVPLGRVGNVVQVSAAGLANTDPAVKALKEVAEPMGRSYAAMFGSGDKKERWFRRIFGELRLFRKEETTFSKATKESLKKIEEKPVGAGIRSTSINMGSGLGGASGLIKGLFGGGILAGIGRAGKGLLKRIPIIGSLLAGAGAAFDIYGSEADESLTRQQKDVAAGKSIGGWSGSLAGIAGGAAVGSMAGPVGAIIGGVVGGFLGDQAGQIIGEKFGAWVSDLREADIPSKIISIFERWTDGFDFSKGFKLWLERTKSNITTVADVAAEQLNDFNAYVDKTTGTNFKELGAAWWEHTQNNFNNGSDWLLNNTTLGKAGKGAFNAVKAAGDFNGGSIAGLSNAQSKAFAAEVQKTESGGDPRAENAGGYVGKYQFGADALADTGLVDLSKLKAARARSGFSQKAFLADPSNWALAGGKDAFLSDSTLQDKIFTDYTNKNLMTGLRSRAISTASKPEEIAAYLKSAHLVGAGGANDLFLRGIDRVDGNNVPASLYAKQGAAAISNMVPTANVSVPVKSAPAAPVMPAYGDAPPVIIPLSSDAGREKIQVVEVERDVSQDVRDRTIAHLATGGIGQRYGW